MCVDRTWKRRSRFAIPVGSGKAKTSNERDAAQEADTEHRGHPRVTRHRIICRTFSVGRLAARPRWLQVPRDETGEIS